MTDIPEPIDLQGQRYERLGVLGSGGQGVVYRAYDHWAKRPVAIKVMSSAAARQPHMAERLSREQQALSALKGTNAVEVLDIYRGNEGELCLVMELLKGANLDEYLLGLEAAGARMDLSRVVEIFDPIVDTLEIAHRAGIVHRDLKPANVFLLDDGGVRLLDFGMARMRKSTPLTADGTVMGSPSFMAPEAWKGQSAAVDHRADVYSLGVILFRVLAGDLPFSGLSLYEKMLGSTRAARPSLVAKRPEFPRDADEWVALALAINRDERFQNVRALWSAFLTTFDVEAPRGKRPSFWTKAAGKVRELAGVTEPTPSGEPVPSKREPSFVTQALARSVMPVEPTNVWQPVSPAEDATIELSERTIELPPPNATPASRAAIENAPTVASERPVEKTLELSASNLVPVEDTLPANAESPSPARQDAAVSSEKEAARSGAESRGNPTKP